VVEVWRAHGYGELLPLQAKALSEYLFLRDGNLVVFAPPSSGKTFVAEMAAVRLLTSKATVFRGAQNIR